MARRVLVVDDEKLIVKGIRFSLEQDGMEVTSAYDGEEAVELAKQYGNDASKAFVNGILAKLTKSRDVKEGSGEAE